MVCGPGRESAAEALETERASDGLAGSPRSQRTGRCGGPSEYTRTAVGRIPRSQARRPRAIHHAAHGPAAQHTAGPAPRGSAGHLQPGESVSRYNLPMRHTYEEVQQFARELPEDQRILLATSLWDSADADADETEIAAAWEPEIVRRVEEIKAGTAVTYSLAEVEADGGGSWSPRFQRRDTRTRPVESCSLAYCLKAASKFCPPEKIPEWSRLRP
jgi:putative addiction module component (TIGR02574 family)